MELTRRESVTGNGKASPYTHNYTVGLSIHVFLMRMALSNAFAVLGVAAEDVALGSSTNGFVAGKKEGSNKSSVDVLDESNKCIQQTSPMATANFKLPLAWIDLEMTGLNVEADRILEIACIITDGKLSKSIEGPDLVIHQSEECMDNMGEWCKVHHASSGLTKKVLRSTISEREAEMQMIDFVKKNIGTHTPLLAGNSVYMDFLFLKKYMPELASLFAHVLVDVSSITALCVRWFPREFRRAPTKQKNHRAMDDIRESIAELKYYRENIFKASPMPRK